MYSSKSYHQESNSLVKLWQSLGGMASLHMCRLSSNLCVIQPLNSFKWEVSYKFCNIFKQDLNSDMPLLSIL